MMACVQQKVKHRLRARDTAQQGVFCANSEQLLCTCRFKVLPSPAITGVYMFCRVDEQQQIQNIMSIALSQLTMVSDRTNPRRHGLPGRQICVLTNSTFTDPPYLALDACSGLTLPSSSAQP